MSSNVELLDKKVVMARSASITSIIFVDKINELIAKVTELEEKLNAKSKNTVARAKAKSK